MKMKMMMIYINDEYLEGSGIPKTESDSSHTLTIQISSSSSLSPSSDVEGRRGKRRFVGQRVGRRVDRRVERRRVERGGGIEGDKDGRLLLGHHYYMMVLFWLCFDFLDMNLVVVGMSYQDADAADADADADADCCTSNYTHQLALVNSSPL